MKILLIAGGWSSEREISLIGARGMKAAIEALGHTVTMFDPALEFDHLMEQASRHDFAMLNLHGTAGEDGLIQAMLDNTGCPYNGAGPTGSFLAVHKACSKQVFRRVGIPTADWEYLPLRPAPDWKSSLPYPVFVKSNMGGSSLHMGRATCHEELHALIDDIFNVGDTVLVEREIHGREVTCAVLGDLVLPPILIEPMKGDFFDYESKYAHDGAREICPAPIGEALTRKVQEYTVQACEALALDGYGRADFMLDDDDGLHILEVNTLPGMTPTSLVPHAAATAGMDFPALMDALIHLGIERSRIRNRR